MRTCANHHIIDNGSEHPTPHVIPAPERRPIQKSSFTMIWREYVPKYTVRVPQLGQHPSAQTTTYSAAASLRSCSSACAANAANSCFNKPRRLHDREDKWQRGRFRMSWKVMTQHGCLGTTGNETPWEIVSSLRQLASTFQPCLRPRHECSLLPGAPAEDRVQWKTWSRQQHVASVERASKYWGFRASGLQG